MALTAKQKAFADEYLIDLNATQAYIRAGYKARGNAAEVNASRLLSNAKVQSYIQKRMLDREKRTEITQDMVLQRWWAIATADPNDLVRLRRLCCRYCFGIDHMYQWRDDEEYQRALTAERMAAAKDGREPKYPSDAGGYGFDSSIKPHPKCPKCKGEGVANVFIADTKDSPAAPLYAGIKETQSGIEIRMHDQLKAMEYVARHLGMFNDKVTVDGSLTLEQALGVIDGE